MGVCCCSLAGTAACQHCRNNPFATDIWSNTITTDYTAVYWKVVDDILSSSPKHYTREEAKKRLMDIGVMDENENLIPPYDEIFIKKEKNDG